MELIDRQIDAANKLLSYALSRPPAKIGMRLKPESELSKILKLGRRCINDSLAGLAEAGVVDRRRGSGTFVRKVLPQKPALESFWQSCVIFDTSIIFTSPLSGVSQISRLGCGMQKLHFGLWSDWAVASPTQQSRISGMIRSIESHGHYMTMHDLVIRPHIPHSVEALHAKIIQHPCDGYLVVARWAELFLNALGDSSIPIVFCGAQCGPYHQPNVTHAALSVLTQAIGLLRDGGFQKIAVIGFAAPSMTAEVQKKAYLRAMEDFGLDYHKALYVDGNSVNLISTVIEFLKQDDRPEALYISDDRLIPFVDAAFNALNIVPGKNMGLISLANKQSSILPSPSWSRMEFDQEVIGQMAAEMLIKKVSQTIQTITNITIQPTWVPGQTHLKHKLQNCGRLGIVDKKTLVGVF